MSSIGEECVNEFGLGTRLTLFVWQFQITVFINGGLRAP